MGDFFQNGLVTTLHNLRNRPVEDLEKKLVELSDKNPMALIIPSLFSELEGPALRNIVEQLKSVPYLSEIVIGIDRANQEQFEYAKEFFSVLPQHHRLLWNDGPRLRKLDQQLFEADIAPLEKGKGRNAWYCFGYLIASGKSEAIALHDADILTYDRGMLARLLYPVADPSFNFRFCKGYYFRCNDTKMNGRVTRLLVTPLLRTLKKFFCNMDFLDYLDSFRYPLSGEFSMNSDVISNIRIPSDWGLEIGILSEVQRINSFNRICQVDIGDCYDHKHQPVSIDNINRGLSKMSIDITKAIFKKLASNGVSFSIETVRSIKATYSRIAEDFVEKYYSDAVLNGYEYNRNEEEEMVHLFARNIYLAGSYFLHHPMDSSFIPSWKRVISAFPEFPELFYNAVEEDNKMENKTTYAKNHTQ
jgi:glucosyl-3-phosphoglycerate synthase